MNLSSLNGFNEKRHRGRQRAIVTTLSRFITAELVVK
jgi:hypothetical protein